MVIHRVLEVTVGSSASSTTARSSHIMICTGSKVVMRLCTYFNYHLKEKSLAEIIKLIDNPMECVQPSQSAKIYQKVPSTV
ncbi:hypothetical protein ACTXT7_002188 [Hymenolepis weldensis]